MGKKTKKANGEAQIKDVNATQTLEEHQMKTVPATIVEGSQEQVFDGQPEEQTVSTEAKSQAIDSQAANVGETQSAEKSVEKKPRVNKRPYIEFVVEHLAVGDCDRKELVKLIMEKFQGLSKGGVETFLTDAKNPKYSYFKDRPVIQHPKTGKLIFADCVDAEVIAKNSPEAATIEATTDGLQAGE